jgi:methylated-DNA-protein-cysteine methyltransferase related protein
MMNMLRQRSLDEGPFKAAVLDTVAQIPAGKVASFEDIASALGYPEDAGTLVRWVVGSPSAGEVPWHRVVEPDGSLPIRLDAAPVMQASRLAEEGVEVEPDVRIDLDRYRYEITPRFRGPVVSQR